MLKPLNWVAFATCLLLPTLSFANADKLASVTTEQVQAVVQAININTASVEQLVQLKGIGQKKAQAIVNYREQYGKFVNVEDILEVKGIGEKILLDNKELLSL